MTTRNGNLESLLVTLGDARQAGAFDGATTSYPWQATTVSAQSPKQSWQARLWKVVPLAAAAAVAVLFVGPSWAPEGSGSPIVQNTIDSVTGPETCKTIEGDFNGDGVKNGKDIPVMIEMMRNGEITMSPDEYARALLNG